MKDKDIVREQNYINRIEVFKERTDEFFANYENLSGGEECLEVCLIRDGCRAVSQAEETINRLQAENENLKDILYDADGVNLVNYWHQQYKISENGCRNYGEENKNLKAENERLKSKCENTQVGYNFLKDELEETKKRNRDLVYAIKSYKAEAYKECIEKIEQRDVSESDDYIMIKKNKFENILNELVCDK